MQPAARATSMSYLLTNAQMILQQQMSQLMGTTQWQPCGNGAHPHTTPPPPMRPSAKRSLAYAQSLSWSSTRVLTTSSSPQVGLGCCCPCL